MNEKLKFCKLLGTNINVITMDETVDYMDQHLDELRGKYVCVSNVHTTVMAHDDPQYYKVQAESLLSVPDGKPLSVIGRKKFPQMNRVTGPDLMRRLFEESKEKKIRHYFYGTTQENINALLEKIKKEYPWVEVVGYEPSVFRPLSEEEENALIARINQTNPDIVWVALGAPRQEEFCYKMQGKINGLMIGVGGAFNVVSGVIDEAPQWMQDISMEWFYRFIKEPKRLFKRYFTTNSRFLILNFLRK